ncbi:leucyl aminopeptidase [Candidatus Lariskella endosymbiont of Epinotia ramella]|uniref:leucyl aminopeptidase n=1 Tax=Candidatus Lariskella endosymbiont of Epinotia ramella TaxID=3066224 RepID=UPI0030CE6601
MNNMEFSFGDLKSAASKVSIFLVSESLLLPQTLLDLDSTNVVSKAIDYNQETQFFSGKSSEILSIHSPAETGKALILLVGIGNIKSLTELKLINIGGSIATRLNRLKISKADLVIELEEGVEIDANAAALAIVSGIKLKNYGFNEYYVAKKSEHLTYIKHVNVMLDDFVQCQTKFQSTEAVIDGALFSRDLISKPANDLFPESFVEIVKGLSQFGLQIKILNASEMQSLGMGALLGVAQGSVKEPYLAIMEWKGNLSSPETPPIAFVGKGVTFDTGGINIKTHSSISEMKYDMGGAGVVTGLMMALAKRKANVNAVGVLGLVENMPSGTAQRPSDVIRTMSGQTVEVDNTDAEGRLVLADALWYTQKEYKPKLIIDLATLTGAITIALGDLYGGLFSNNEEIARQLMESGNKTGEHVWQLPMHEHYDKQINSDIADVKNTGSGRGAGSITAAHFLHRFVNNYPWAHLDIAGVTWNKHGTDHSPKGATGFGVRLLDRFISDYYENEQLF